MSRAWREHYENMTEEERREMADRDTWNDGPDEPIEEYREGGKRKKQIKSERLPPLDEDVPF